jgi:hypothetical protein
MVLFGRVSSGDLGSPLEHDPGVLDVRWRGYGVENHTIGDFPGELEHA